MIEDAQAQQWFDQVRQDLVPKIADSVATIVISPPNEEAVDLQMAIEVGLAILLSKPLILMMDPGRTVPPKLRLVADAIVEGDPRDPGVRARFAQVLNGLSEECGLSEH